MHSTETTVLRVVGDILMFTSCGFTHEPVLVLVGPTSAAKHRLPECFSVDHNLLETFHYLGCFSVCVLALGRIPGLFTWIMSPDAEVCLQQNCCFDLGTQIITHRHRVTIKTVESE